MIYRYFPSFSDLSFVSCRAQFLILMKLNSSIFHWLFVVLVLYLRISCRIQGHKDIHLSFRLRILYFCFLHLCFDPFGVIFYIWCEVRIQFPMWTSSCQNAVITDIHVLLLILGGFSVSILIKYGVNCEVSDSYSSSGLACFIPSFVCWVLISWKNWIVSNAFPA